MKLDITLNTTENHICFKTIIVVLNILTIAIIINEDDNQTNVYVREHILGLSAISNFYSLQSDE